MERDESCSPAWGGVSFSGVWPRPLVWVLADNPARFFYEGLGGRLVAERTELFWGADVRERAYGWSDLNTVVRATGSLASPYCKATSMPRPEARIRRRTDG